MKNYISEGKKVEFTAGANVLSGEPVVIGDLVGVSATDVLNGAEGVAEVEGVFLLTKKGADVIAKGVKLYWDAALKEVTITAAANKVVGYAYEAAGAAVLTVTVKLAR